MLPLERLTHRELGKQRLFPDQLGILIALDHALEKRKHRYPFETVRGLINTLHALPLPPEIPAKDYFTAIQHAIETANMDPWDGDRIALVGYVESVSRRSSLERDGLHQLLRGATVIDLSRETTGRMLTSYNALAQAGEKVDYVITGNVLNAPDNGPSEQHDAFALHSPPDTMHACATLLKQGGRAIHLLGYGPGNPHADCVADTALHRRIGQQHLYTFPQNERYADNASPAAMIFEQTRAIEPSPTPSASEVQRIRALFAQRHGHVRGGG